MIHRKDLFFVYDYSFPENEDVYFANGTDYTKFLDFYKSEKSVNWDKYHMWYFKKTKNSYPQSYLCTPKFLANCNQISFFEYTQNLKDYKTFLYPISIFCDASTSMDDLDNYLFDKISKPALEEIKNSDNFILFVNYFFEGYLTTKQLSTFYDWLDRHNIAKKKVYLCWATYGLEEFLSKFSEQYETDEHIEFIEYVWPLYYLPERFSFYKQKLSNETYNESYKVKKKKYDFNCLIGQNRFHRIALLAYLESVKLLDKNLVSYDLKKYDSTFEDYWYQFANDICKPPFEFEHFGIHFFKVFLENPKRIIDIENLESVHGMGMENANIYKDTMFTIVPESYFVEQDFVRYISEKIFKPIMHNNPFIVMAKPYTLQYLQKQGFKTFHPFIDEEYDKIEEDWPRMMFIFEEIDRICAMSSEEKKQWMKNVKPIVDFNYKHFCSGKYGKTQKELLDNLPTFHKL